MVVISSGRVLTGRLDGWVPLYSILITSTARGAQREKGNDLWGKGGLKW